MPSSPPAARVPLPPEIKVMVAAAFVIAIGFGIIAPLLPQYAEMFASDFANPATAVAALCLTAVPQAASAAPEPPEEPPGV